MMVFFTPFPEFWENLATQCPNLFKYAFVYITNKSFNLQLQPYTHNSYMPVSCRCSQIMILPHTGAPLPPPQPSAPNPDYVQCPYCQRRFQEAAAERHIPFCKEQSSRIERKAPSTKAKDVYNKRMQVRHTKNSVL